MSVIRNWNIFFNISVQSNQRAIFDQLIFCFKGTLTAFDGEILSTIVRFTSDTKKVKECLLASIDLLHDHSTKLEKLGKYRPLGKTPHTEKFCQTKLFLLQGNLKSRVI